MMKEGEKEGRRMREDKETKKTPSVAYIALCDGGLVTPYVII